jgi:surface protein
MATKSASRPGTTNPTKEENYNYIRWLNRIGKKKGIQYGFVSDPAHVKGMYKPLMESSQKYLRTDDDIKKAVKRWCNPDTHAKAEERYGHISDWDVSSVTNMSELFREKKTFNDDISRWNVSNVTNMYMMFGDAFAFNQPIGDWNVSKVVDMSFMFFNARTFNQPIGGWDVSNVTNMGDMFEGAFAFNQPIEGWNISKVANMSGMFWGAKSFNQPIGAWNVSDETNISNMFNNANAFISNGDLIYNVQSNWDNVNTNQLFYTNPLGRRRGGAKRATRKRSRKSRRTLKRGSRRTRKR